MSSWSRSCGTAALRGRRINIGAQLMFLGLMLANLDGTHSLSLTRKRRDGLLALISEWESWGAERGTQPMRADPRTLASLLGKLVFASQAVWNGRPFMQSMLSAFA